MILGVFNFNEVLKFGLKVPKRCARTTPS